MGVVSNVLKIGADSIDLKIGAGSYVLKIGSDFKAIEGAEWYTAGGSAWYTGEAAYAGTKSGSPASARDVRIAKMQACNRKRVVKRIDC